MTLSAEQLEQRRHGLGASEVPAVAGLVPWRSPLEVYLLKAGLVEPTSETPRMRAGNKLERAILEWGGEELAATAGIAVVATGERTLRHPKHEWLLATPDGRCPGEQGLSTGCPVVQVKNVGERSAKYWGDSGTDAIPDYVRAQVEIEMEVVGTREAYVFALLGGHDLRIYPLRRDPELADALVEICRRFWFEHVVPRVPPPLDGSDAARDWLARRWSSHTEDLADASPEIDAAITRLAALREVQRQAEDERAVLEQRIQEFIGDRGGVLGSHGRVTWRRATLGRVSWEKVARDLQATPEVIERHRGAPARRFLFTPTETKEG